MDNLLNNSIDLVILISLGVLFLFSYGKMKSTLLSKFGKAKNTAITILFLGSIIASAVNLVHISSAASDAILFFLNKNDMLMAIFYALCFFAFTWLFSLILFKFSFVVVSYLTKEDETDELIKNNIEIALLHAIILITLTFVIAPALVKIAVSFIPYPDMPF
jgi:hypothetical protein